MIPAGWTPSIERRRGLVVWIASCDARPELRFEATSPEDLEDQVHEALDAWQTELELALAISAGGRR